MRCAYSTFSEILRKQNILEIWEDNMKINFSEMCGLDSPGSGHELVARLCVNGSEFWGL